MKQVTLITDGSCLNNPGPGGWACILCYNAVEKELTGFDPKTSNNRMELTALLEGLKALKEPCIVDLVTDSQYLVTGVANCEQWEKKNWRGSNRKRIKNTDLWKQLIPSLKTHSVVPRKVKGHSENLDNRRADNLARLSAQGKTYRINSNVRSASTTVATHLRIDESGIIKLG